MALATSLPLSTSSATSSAVAVVRTTVPNIVKDSNSGSNSFSVAVSTQYNLGSGLNASITPSVINVANTKTVLPTIEYIYDINAGGDKYKSTSVVTDVAYTIGTFSPNNYIIPTSVNMVANSKTVLPTVEWLYNIGAKENAQYANTVVVTDSAYTIGLANNYQAPTNIAFVGNSRTTINALAIQGQVLASVIVPTLSSDVTTLYIKPYTPNINSLINTRTINDFPQKPYKVKNEYVVVVDRAVNYGSNTGSLSANVNPGITYVPAFTRTINDFPQKPYRAKGETSSVTYNYVTMATIVSRSSELYWNSPLRVNTQAYANSIYLIKSGSATSVTNYYGTGGGFDPNSPYLGASTAYWS